MVDWNRVQELRDKGWDWDRIAEDPKVAYQAPPGVTDNGRALRSLYAKRARTSSRDSVTDDSKAAAKTVKKSNWTLARVGIILTPLFAIWFLIAYFIPSPVGVILSAIPTLALLLAVAAAVLAFGLLRSDKKWTATLRGGLAAGIVLGLVISAGAGIGGLLAGYPTLTGICSSQPDNFHGCSNALWTDSGSSSGKPVYFFFGSAACPYCSASSWAMLVALERFGTISGEYPDYSNPNDIYPNTPEMVLANAVLSSNYISLQVAENTYTGQIILPGFANEYQTAYYAAYDSGGSIPFVVIGGQYYTVGTLVSPPDLSGLTTSQVLSDIDSQTGVWEYISPAADWLTAFLLKVDGGQPASLLTGNVLSDYDQIS